MTLKRKFRMAVFAGAVAGLSCLQFAHAIVHSPSAMDTQVATTCKLDLAQGRACSEFGRHALALDEKNEAELWGAFSTLGVGYGLIAIVAGLGPRRSTLKN